MAHIRPEKYIWLDGQLVPWNESHVHFLTHSLHYGLAAFEGIRAYAQQGLPAATGAVFRLAASTPIGLFDSCKLCLIDVPYSRERGERGLH
jgi:branched-chain amino acid aminotransferase